MAGHSQNRRPFHYGTCPACGRKGLGREKQHWNTVRRVLCCYRECRLCRYQVATEVRPTAAEGGA